jgi:hypothetical protein
MIATAIHIVNAVSLVIFLLLLGATLFSMVGRVLDYRRAKLPLPVLLKRGIVLFVALVLIGGETAVLRALGVTLGEASIERLIFITQANAILLIALGYYAKVELFDLDDEDKP